MAKTTMDEGLAFIDYWDLNKSNFRKIEKDKQKKDRLKKQQSLNIHKKILNNLLR